MVLLPKLPSPDEKKPSIARNTFFENDELDFLARHFVGNNNRWALGRDIESIPIFHNLSVHYNLTSDCGPFFHDLQTSRKHYYSEQFGTGEDQNEWGENGGIGVGQLFLQIVYGLCFRYVFVFVGISQWQVRFSVLYEKYLNNRKGFALFWILNDICWNCSIYSSRIWFGSCHRTVQLIGESKYRHTWCRKNAIGPGSISGDALHHPWICQELRFHRTGILSGWMHDRIGRKSILNRF